MALPYFEILKKPMEVVSYSVSCKSFALHRTAYMQVSAVNTGNTELSCCFSTFWYTAKRTLPQIPPDKALLFKND